MKVLVTGGTGYIGSHVVVELLNNGFDVLIVDNLSNSKHEVVNRIQKITSKKPPFIELDLKNKQKLDWLFEQNKIDAVMHFAGFKSVSESVKNPLLYYENNILSTVNLCATMQKYNVKKLIFSSSATVYGEPDSLPLTEMNRVGVGITNPYGQTKFMIEQILRDILVSDSAWQITSLRYFNPIGAHESGLIGEDPNGTPNNLMPYVTQVAIGKLDHLDIFGNDYGTTDGTGVRDYIHVVDLAKGHIAALKKSSSFEGLVIYNLGTGKGSSVLELVKAFETATGQKVTYQIKPRRSGDLAINYADVTKANRELSWRAIKTLEDACIDTWRWQKNNPNGYS